jgi:glutamate racemase
MAFFIQTMSDNPIGFFDSGVGGTSIWKEVIDVLPKEDTIYIADSINAPYGKKTQDEIIRLCIQCTERLIEQKCKLIVVACNTATTNAIDYLRTRYDIPFIGIEPAIKPALLNTKTNTIGVLATKGTLSSSLFESTKNKFGEDVHIIEQIGTGIVELIETNQLESRELSELVKSYVEPMIAQNIDYLVLGCSHYPYLKPILVKLLPVGIEIIDSGEAVALHTKSRLENQNLLSERSEPSKHLLMSNGNKDTLEKLTFDQKLEVEYQSFAW